MIKNTYTEYIRAIFSCVSQVLPQGKNPVVAFSEGNLPGAYSGSVDFAILRNKNAVLFINTIHENCQLFGVQKEEFLLQKSKILKGDVKCRHRCYPKNLRRWLKGTISRKKVCRVEFITLLYCWAIQWETAETVRGDTPVIQALFSICKQYCSDLSEKDSILKCLWCASEQAYQDTFGK